jgi:hypothetical protein
VARRGHNERVADDARASGEPEEEQAPRRWLQSRTADAAGIVTGTVGVVAFSATLNGLERIAGLLCGVAAGALAWRAARDRERGQLSTPMIWHLALAACAVVVLIVVLDSRGTGSQTTAMSPGQVTSTPAQRGSGAPGGASGEVRGLLGDLESVERHGEWSRGAPSMRGTIYVDGLVACANHRCCQDAQPSIVFNLDGRYDTFRATVGIDDDAPVSRATFSVQLDDGSRRDSPSLVNGGTYQFEIPVKSARRLRLIVSVDTCGSSFVWGDARLT